MKKFLNIIDWLYSISAQFGADNIVIGNRVYWLDTDKDRQALYELYKKENNLKTK